MDVLHMYVCTVPILAEALASVEKPFHFTPDQTRLVEVYLPTLLQES